MPADLRTSSSDSRQPAPESSVAASLATASWCARRGWPVHPPGRRPQDPGRQLHPVPHDSAPARRVPVLPAGRWCHGFHAATLDQRHITRWWGAHPEFGVGVACGPAGLVVIDIDAHLAQPPTRDRILPGIPIGDDIDLTGLANGFHALAVLAALRGQRSPAEDDTTLRVRTPRAACTSGTGQRTTGAGAAAQAPARAPRWPGRSTSARTAATSS
ncbi:bifunctional DNA primase/polymerase [Streptomyces mirabilis]|uniref:bifunctional DNA primase/polymerase n=1 Tax=Streptomyces mirabilis TaxID=68239 RepID=UPI0036BBF3B8